MYTWLYHIVIIIILVLYPQPINVYSHTDFRFSTNRIIAQISISMPTLKLPTSGIDFSLIYLTYLSQWMTKIVILEHSYLRNNAI